MDEVLSRERLTDAIRWISGFLRAANELRETFGETEGFKVMQTALVACAVELDRLEGTDNVKGVTNGKAS